MTDRPWMQARWAASVLPIAAIVFAVCAWALLDRAPLHHLMNEEGPVEQLSWMFWFAAALAFAVLARPEDVLSTRVCLVVMLLAFGARELDLHKTLTGKSVLKVSFYFDKFPLHQKLVALAIVTIVVAALWVLLKRYARRVWRGCREGDTVCTTVLIFVVTLVVSKVLDRAINVLLVDYGVVTPKLTGALIGSLEETLELALPLIAGFGLAQHLLRRR